MRHKKKGKRLNRNSSQRKALFRNLIQNLVEHGRIETTIAKAKAIKPLVDKLVNKAKEGTLSARREVMSFLPSKKAANKLVDQIAPDFKDKVGGAVRIIRTGRRKGDNAMMAKVEWVDDAEESKRKNKGKKKEKGNK
jgi:large subunit ribosomal protein L17